jgi:hypothetical protein
VNPAILVNGKALGSEPLPLGSMVTISKVAVGIPTIREGSRVRFIAHGETGLPYTVVTIEGDDCDLLDMRGRRLARVPIELLVLAPAEKLGAIRAVDELR